MVPRDRPLEPIIDVLGIVYDRGAWEGYLRWYADGAPGYLRALARQFCAAAVVDEATYLEALRVGPQAAVDVLVAGAQLGVDIESHVRRLRDQGVERQVMAGCPAQVASGGTVNDRIAALAAPYRALLVPWAGITLRDGAAAVAEMRRCVLELGMAGVVVNHFFDGVDPLSRECHEFYAAAAELGVPAWIHTGHNLSPRSSVCTCTWREIDEIARHHPGLRIVAGHGCWPWVLEMIAVCQRHANVYLELSTHRAPHVAARGSGWEPLLCYGATTIRTKVLFGSCEWVHGMSVRALADEYADLGLERMTLRRWLHGNARALLDEVVERPG